MINTASEINVFGSGFAVLGLGFKNLRLNFVFRCWNLLVILAFGGLGAEAPGLQIHPEKGETLPSWKRWKRAGWVDPQFGASDLRLDALKLPSSSWLGGFSTHSTTESRRMLCWLYPRKQVRLLPVFVPLPGERQRSTASIAPLRNNITCIVFL